MANYAHDFYEISETVDQNTELRDRTLDLVSRKRIPGKATDGGDRTEKLRNILKSFFNGDSSVDKVIGDISVELSRHESRHSRSNQVFSDGWEERLARTQISRFYNEAMLRLLKNGGDEQCFIPHSDHEKPDSPCTIQLAGGTAEIDRLIDRLDRAYDEGEWHDKVMIPNHPHCTHTILPEQST